MAVLLRPPAPPDADSALQGKRKPELEWNVFWPRWGELDGNGAMRDLAELAKTGVADDIGLPQAAGMVMGSWAAGDPEAAKAWFAGMDPDGRCFRLDDVNLCPQTALIIFPRDVLFVAVLKKER